ncbi:MAG: hypothetical protein GEU77_08460 [Deltaproteobacteria bacterium]|nr:hypothetical protein [Deltaproteobacteria bacterium]
MSVASGATIRRYEQVLRGMRALLPRLVSSSPRRLCFSTSWRGRRLKVKHDVKEKLGMLQR